MIACGSPAPRREQAEGAFGWTARTEEQFRFHLVQTRELGGYLCGRRLDTRTFGSRVIYERYERARDDSD